MPKPSVGRAVHYVSHGSADGTYGKRCRAATVAEVDQIDPELVGLAVLNPTGLFFKPISDGGCHYQDPGNNVPSPAGADGGTWHWPERVEE